MRDTFNGVNVVQQAMCRESWNWFWYNTEHSPKKCQEVKHKFSMQAFSESMTQNKRTKLIMIDKLTRQW